MLEFLNKHRRALFITGSVMLLLVIGFYALALYSVRTLFDSDSATPTARQYSEWVGLWLPEDMENFQAYGEGWQDWLVEARFELTVSQLAEFLERNNLQRNDSETLPESSYGLEWFRATGRLETYEIKPSPSSAVSTSTGFYPSIWVNSSEIEKITVYIKAFDT
jgi:hypothetical protein